MSRNKEYDRIWREKNRIKIRKYQREYIRKKRRENKELLYKSRAEKETTTNYLKKNSTSYIGREYELLALKLLPYSIDCNKKNFSGEYDILHKGRKVEVKMRCKRKNRWVFSFKKTCTADWCFLFCVSEMGNKIERIVYQPYNGAGYVCIKNINASKYECYNSKRSSLIFE